MSTSTHPWKSATPDPFSEITTADPPAPPSALRSQYRTSPLTNLRPPASQATPAQTQAWASFLAGAVHNGLDPTLVTQWLTILADATGSPVLPSLASMPLGDYVNLRLPVILTGLESTTHAPYLAGWHLRIEPELGPLPLRLITTALITAAVLGWIADGCSRSTIKNTLAMLSRIFEQAIVDGILERNPAHITGWQREYQQVEDDLRDPRSLALRDWDALTELADALVAASYNRYRGWGDVVVHSACTATRIGEVSGVRARDVDTDKWLLTCRRQTTPAPGGLVDKHTKGRIARFIPIIEPLRPLVARRLQATHGDPDARLYTGPRGGRISTAVLRDATHWDEVTSDLGYEHLRRHDLRHTGLTWMADAGILPHILKEIAGHRLITTTQRYFHPDVLRILEAGQALTHHLEKLQCAGQITRRW
ncbi:tyrosine-type recombinase/integrase [Kitasatospora sp. NPDC094011]|uniref:tyrosine-type recombinase/integrase n=1 Tax=Kitasatospora sp. NPDC094011 TaxID=3364090 RepID=UPI00382C1FEC